MTNPYNQNSGPVYPSGPVYQQPQKPDRTMAVLLSVIGVIVLIGLGVLGTLFFLRNDDGGSETPPPAAEQPAQQAPPAAQAPQQEAPAPQAQPQQVQPQAPAPAPAPAPAQGVTPSAAMSADGFVYPCENSSAMRQVSTTGCGWARNVESELSRRGSGFSGVSIWSPLKDENIPTTCVNTGTYYRCSGVNTSIAIPR